MFVLALSLYNTWNRGVFLLCKITNLLIYSYYFILQPDYSIPQADVQEDNTPFIADDENSYLEEQKDGSYIFYYGKYKEELSKEDVESGVYDSYPIIKYNNKSLR